MGEGGLKSNIENEFEDFIGRAWWKAEGAIEIAD